MMRARRERIFRLVLGVLAGAAVPTAALTGFVLITDGDNVPAYILNMIYFFSAFSISVMCLGFLPMHFWLKKRGRFALRGYLVASLITSPLFAFAGILGTTAIYGLFIGAARLLSGSSLL